MTEERPDKHSEPTECPPEPPQGSIAGFVLRALRWLALSIRPRRTRRRADQEDILTEGVSGTHPSASTTALAEPGHPHSPATAISEVGEALPHPADAEVREPEIGPTQAGGHDSETAHPPLSPKPAQTNRLSALDEAPAETTDARFTVVIGDTEGDVATLKKNLGLAGILDGDGNIDQGLLRQLSVMLVDEGDAIRKQAPDGTYLVYRQQLIEDMADRVHSVALAGNHELERLQAGLSRRQAKLMERKGLDPEYVLDVIRGLDVFHISPPLLYLHGYPTVDFLRLLWKKYGARGKDPILLNEEFRRSVLQGGEAIDTWSYRKGNGKKYLLHDVGNADKYYSAHEKEITRLCEKLGIHTIVIGHRPCARGVQEAHVLRRDSGKKARQDAKSLHDSLVRRIATGDILSANAQWGPNGEVVILRNDVLGKSNKNEYGMLLIRQRADRIDILPINTRYHDPGRIREFMRGG